MHRAVFTSLAVLAVATSNVRAEPAMWVIRDSDSTIYLVGTMHIVKPEIVWDFPEADESDS